MAVETHPCDVCGDPVTWETDPVWDGDEDNEPYFPVCICCYGVICDKHTADVTCPHAPSAHGVEYLPPSGARGEEG